MRSVRAAIGRIEGADPGLIRENLQSGRDRLEDQGSLAAAVVAEALLAEVPEKDRYRVVAFLEERGDVHLVVVGAVGERSALEASLKHSQLTVDPHPVLRVRRDAGDQSVGTFRDLELLAVGDPGVGRALAQGWGDPVSLPIRTGLRAGQWRASESQCGRDGGHLDKI